MSNVTLSPPSQPLPYGGEAKIESVDFFLKKDLFNYFNNLYQFLYFIWQRTGGYTSSVSTYSSDLTTQASAGTSAGNLSTYILPANSVNSYAQIDGFGTFAANTNIKRLQLYFGSTLILDTSSLSLNGGTWDVKVTIVKVNDNSQKIIVVATSSNPSLMAKSFYTAASENLSTNVLVKFVATGVAIKDIVQECLIVQIN